MRVQSIVYPFPSFILSKSFPFSLWLFLLLSSSSFRNTPGARAAAATSTIDDANPAFTFVSAWNAVSPSNPCDGCASKLDSTQVFDGTWHDGSVAGSTASLKFQGTGISLYGVTNSDQTCALTFTLDGGNPTSLDLSSIPESPTKVYNYLFFSASGLSGTSTHTLAWTIENSVDNAVAFIDYAVVTSTSSAAAATTTQASGDTATITTAGAGNSGTSTSIGPSSSISQTSTSQSTSPTSSAASTSTPTTTSSKSTFTSTLSTASAYSSIILVTVGGLIQTSTISPLSLPSPTEASSSTPAPTLIASSASQRTSKTSTIVGAVVGGVLGCLVLVGLGICLFSRTRRRSTWSSLSKMMKMKKGKAPSSQINGLESFRYDPSLDTSYPPEKYRRAMDLDVENTPGSETGQHMQNQNQMSSFPTNSPSSLPAPHPLNSINNPSFHPLNHHQTTGSLFLSVPTAHMGPSSPSSQAAFSSPTSALTSEAGSTINILHHSEFEPTGRAVMTRIADAPGTGEPTSQRTTDRDPDPEPTTMREMEQRIVMLEQLLTAGRQPLDPALFHDTSPPPYVTNNS
ncbi:hypothetical protein F5880DRAFT_449983 [Lentinula raphanica]|nr:hypothetical protein F5880DRAFT_449983 [Lentinula raphanica]